MNIFFDLDGTLIDSRQRLYQLFQNLVPQSQFSFDDYWNLKRNKINHETILKEHFGFENNDFNLFDKKWMRLIETEEYLDFDEPFDGVSEYLFNLKNNGFSIYLVTARQFKNKVSQQTEKFGWFNLFEKILVTEQKNSKETLVKPYVDSKKSNWIVGDAGTDILTGKILGIKTVAVLSGFLNNDVLYSYKPDLILDNVIHFSPY